LVASPPQAYYSSPSLPSEENWYPDTGATHHLANDIQNLNLSFEEYTGQDQICIGNGKGLSIKHSGSATISLSHKFLLKLLLHVSNICRNLLLVCQFAFDNSVFFEFYPSYFVIKDCKTGIPIHQCQLKNSLCQLFPPHVHPSTPQALVGERTFSHCWHKRLGNPALWIVNLVLSKFQLPVSNKKALQPCKACPQAKGYQLPFSLSTTSICNPLALLYSDVWGPSPTLSLKGKPLGPGFLVLVGSSKSAVSVEFLAVSGEPDVKFLTTSSFWFLGSLLGVSRRFCVWVFLGGSISCLSEFLGGSVLG
jgi:hypothetical protein